MKSNRIRVNILSSIKKAFAFTLNPKNTPLWLDDIVIEETNQWPIKIGTQYKNKNKKGEWSEYIIAGLKENKYFEFISLNKNYHCRYTYKKIDTNRCQLEYYEWVDDGEITKPFTQKPLLKLKKLIEQLQT